MGDIKAMDEADVISLNGLAPANSPLLGLTNTAFEASAKKTQWLGYVFHNNDAATRWVQVFFKPKAQVTVGETKPDFTILIGSQQSIAWDFVRPIGRVGTGLSFAATTTETGSTAPTARVTGQIILWDPTTRR